jgi:hypothetical protein
MTMWKDTCCQLKRGDDAQMERPDATGDRQRATAYEQQVISGSTEELGLCRPDSTEDGQ